MSQEVKAIMHQFYDEILSKGNLDLVEELVADDFVEHEEFPGLVPGKEGLKTFVSNFRSAFPDLKADVEDVLADGNKVIARGRFSGTHRGEFIDIPATGRAIDIQFIDIVEFRDGKAVAHWGLTDQVAMMQQLGVIPDEPAN